MNMKKQSAKLCARIVCLACSLILLCAYSSSKLPGGLTEEGVLAQAQKVVSQLSAGDYRGVTDCFSTDLATQLGADALQQALGAQLSALGGFQSCQSTAVSGAHDDHIGDYAVAVLICQYENGRATYTISIDKSGAICGLYMK